MPQLGNSAHSVFLCFARHGGLNMRSQLSSCVLEDGVKILIIRSNVTNSSQSACSVQPGSLYSIAVLLLVENVWSFPTRRRATCDQAWMSFENLSVFLQPTHVRRVGGLPGLVSLVNPMQDADCGHSPSTFQ